MQKLLEGKHLDSKTCLQSLAICFRRKAAKKWTLAPKNFSSVQYIAFSNDRAEERRLKLCTVDQKNNGCSSELFQFLLILLAAHCDHKPEIGIFRIQEYFTSQWRSYSVITSNSSEILAPKSRREFARSRTFTDVSFVVNFTMWQYWNWHML